MHRYRLFGLTIASELECPELPASAEDADATVTLAPAATHEGQGAGFTARPGQFDLTVPKVARFVVTEGTSIAIQPYPAADDASIRLFLLGTAIGALLHQRGDLPLHGSAVCKDGRSVIVLGSSGAGKSSLGAALGAHGWLLQSDDIAVVRRHDGVAHCEAGFPRRKMWPDMLRQFGYDPAAHDRVRDGIEKRFQSLSPGEFHGSCAPIAAIVALTPGRVAEPELAPVIGPMRMALLKRHTFRANLRAPLQMHVPHFAIISTLATQAQVWRLQRPRVNSSPAALAAMLAPILTQAIS